MTTTFIPTLTPQEAVELSGYTTHAELLTMLSIKKLTKQAVKLTIMLIAPFFLLSTCWTAGKIEGIRAERSRRRRSK